MSDRNLVVRLFVPSQRLTESTLLCFFSSLERAGFRVKPPGDGVGQLWLDIGNGTELVNVESSVDAVRLLAGAQTWGLEMWKGSDDQEDILINPIFVVSVIPGDEDTSLKVFEISIGSYTIAQDDARNFLELRALAAYASVCLVPLYGWGGSNYGLFDRTATPERTSEILNATLRPIEWLLVFGAHYCQRIGTERLLSAPAWRVDWLIGNSIMLTLAPHPEAVDPRNAVAVADYLMLPLGFPRNLVYGQNDPPNLYTIEVPGADK